MPGRVPQLPGERRRTGARALLEAEIADQIARFHDASVAVDEAAMAALDLTRQDLQCLTHLLFQGPRTRAELVTDLASTAGALDETLERMELAGYVRRVPGTVRGDERVEITEHTLHWVATIWSPIQQDGEQLLGRFTIAQLSSVLSLLTAATELQRHHGARIRALNGGIRASHPERRLRGALSPAALRRVHLFIEANLHRSIAIADLARRAGLSQYHFARAFKKSMNATPRALIERRRVERAKALISESSLPLAVIAVETGFQTQSRLTTAFRKATGITPAVYRRGRRSNRDSARSPLAQ